MREPKRSELAVQVREAAERISAIAAAHAAEGRDDDERDAAARALLVHAAAGFAIAGTVSELLDLYGLPRLGVFGWAAEQCGQMMELLRKVLGPEPPWDALFSGADLQHLQDTGATELRYRGTPETTQTVAAATVTLAAAVQDAARTVAHTSGIPAHLHAAAQIAANIAGQLHGQFGGDGGGLL